MNKEQLVFIAAMSGPDLDGLAHMSPYVSWPTGEKEVKLDGDFSADELEAIVWFMRGGPDKVALPMPNFPRSEEGPSGRAPDDKSRVDHEDFFAALPTRVRNCLWNERIHTAADLARYYAIDKETLRRPLMFLPGFGARSLRAVHTWLKDRGELPGREVGV